MQRRFTLVSLQSCSHNHYLHLFFPFPPTDALSFFTDSLNSLYSKHMQDLSDLSLLANQGKRLPNDGVLIFACAEQDRQMIGFLWILLLSLFSTSLFGGGRVYQTRCPRRNRVGLPSDLCFSSLLCFLCPSS